MRQMTDEWLADQFQVAFTLACVESMDDKIGLAGFQRGFANRVLMEFARDSEQAKAAIAVPFTQRPNP